jgi:hypothetical protein
MGWLDEDIESNSMRAASAVADIVAQEPVDALLSSPLAVRCRRRHHLLLGSAAP